MDYVISIVLRRNFGVELALGCIRRVVRYVFDRKACCAPRHKFGLAQLCSFGHITRHEIFRATFSAADALWLHRHCHKGALSRHDLKSCRNS
jgi:hypothetical protein